MKKLVKKKEHFFREKAENVASYTEEAEARAGGALQERRSGCGDRRQLCGSRAAAVLDPDQALAQLSGASARHLLARS